MLVLQVATPVAVTSYMLAAKYDARPDEVAGLVVVSTLLAVPAIPLLLAFSSELRLALRRKSGTLRPHDVQQDTRAVEMKAGHGRGRQLALLAIIRASDGVLAATTSRRARSSTRAGCRPSVRNGSRRCARPRQVGRAGLGAARHHRPRVELPHDARPTEAHRQRHLLPRGAALERLRLCAGARRHLGRLPRGHRPARRRPRRLRQFLGLHRLVHERRQPGERGAACTTPTTSTSPITRARPASPAAATAARPGCPASPATSSPGRRSTSSSCRPARALSDIGRHRPMVEIAARLRRRRPPIVPDVRKQSASDAWIV